MYLHSLTMAQMSNQIAGCHFLMEVRNQNGELCNGSKLYSIYAGIQCYVCERREQQQHLRTYKDPVFLTESEKRGPLTVVLFYRIQENIVVLGQKNSWHIILLIPHSISSHHET